MSGSTIIDFGKKHNGKTYQEVLDSDKNYCLWVIENCHDTSSPRVRAFYDWLMLINFQ